VQVGRAPTWIGRAIGVVKKCIDLRPIKRGTARNTLAALHARTGRRPHPLVPGSEGCPGSGAPLRAVLRRARTAGPRPTRSGCFATALNCSHGRLAPSVPPRTRFPRSESIWLSGSDTATSGSMSSQPGRCSWTGCGRTRTAYPDFACHAPWRPAAVDPRRRHRRGRSRTWIRLGRPHRPRRGSGRLDPRRPRYRGRDAHHSGPSARARACPRRRTGRRRRTSPPGWPGDAPTSHGPARPACLTCGPTANGASAVTAGPLPHRDGYPG
jgi:hypothetical protein